MEELKRSEQRATVEDLMYASVLERFVELGVPMLPRVESIVESPGDLKSLTEGVHSREACRFPLCTSFSSSSTKFMITWQFENVRDAATLLAWSVHDDVHNLFWMRALTSGLLECRRLTW